MAKEINKEDIQKFLENKCSYDEAEAIAKYLNEHPELLEVYIPFDTAPAQTEFSHHEKRELFRKIKKGSGLAKMHIVRRLSVAAAILIFMSTVGYWLLNDDNRKHEVSGMEKPVASARITVGNSTNELMLLLLPDGSQVKLSAQSEIQYDTLSFRNNREILLLRGSAHFDVRKDVSHPFKVIAEGVQTMALGTDFWVEKPADSNKITVRLLSGKVRLTSVDERFEMDEVELAPGQICAIDKATGRVNVYSAATNLKNQTAKPERAIKDDKAKTVIWTNDGMQFSNAQLKSVLNKIEARYHVKIDVDSEIIRHSVFTGKILNTDSLDQIINSICEINGLTYKKDGDTIIINKKENK